MKIVSAYHGMAKFAAAVLSGAPAPESWQELALAPYWAEWAAGQPFEDRVRREFARPYHDVEALLARTKLLAESGVEQTVAGALERIATLLPKVEETVVCICALDPANQVVGQRQHGVLGECVGDNILLLIDPTVPDWQEWVPQVLAHEWHHTVWGYEHFVVQGRRSVDLLTAMLSDGQAEAFGYLIAPGVKPLWPAFDAETERRVWGEALPLLRSADQGVYMRYMFGDSAAGVPWCYGYQAGYHIVMSYLRTHPEKSVVDLLHLDAWEIFQESGY